MVDRKGNKKSDDVIEFLSVISRNIFINVICKRRF